MIRKSAIVFLGCSLASVSLARAQNRNIEEIVVTANRRAQDVQEIASGIRVLAGEDLEKLGADSFEDYIFTIPGLDVADSGLEKKISIRGVSNVASFNFGAAGSPSPVGLYLGDTPIQGNGVLPDLALYDLERIEVLKGPQGTLYGEGAMAGAIKMLPNRPDPSGYSAKGEVGFGHTRFAGGFNHFQNAALNAPLFGSWAMRIVGSNRENQGFVDFPNRGTRDENDVANRMARVALEGEVWEGFTASPLFLYQRQVLDQFPIIQPTEGGLQNRYKEPQFSDVELMLAALTLRYGFNFAELTSSTSWLRNDRDNLTRLAFLKALLFGTTNPIVDIGVPPVELESEWMEIRTHQVSLAEELRLVSSGDSWLDWIVGGFYRTRTNDSRILVDNSAPDEPPPVGPGLLYLTPEEDFEQLALFGEATLDLPWDLEANLGLRGLRETVDLDSLVYYRGPLFSAGVFDCRCPESAFRTKESLVTSGVTPKISLTWFADDLRMVYANVARGTRSGGTNIAAYSGVQPTFRPDSLWSYEIGTKTQWLDGLFTANVSAFHTMWSDIQVYTLDQSKVAGLTTETLTILNAAKAFTRGVEFELAAVPLEDLLLGFNLSRQEGKIVEGDERQVIRDDTPLPQLAHLSYSALAAYQPARWQLLGFTPFVHFDTQFVGERTMAPENAVSIKTMGAFQTYNATVGFASEAWETSLGVANLTDVRPEFGVNPFEDDTITIGPPRTWTAKFGFRF